MWLVIYFWCLRSLGSTTGNLSVHKQNKKKKKQMRIKNENTYWKPFVEHLVDIVICWY